MGAWVPFAILPLVVMEAAALLLLWRRTGRGVAPGPLLANLAAGACLMAAVGSGMAGSGWVWPLLAGGGIAHLADLRARWR